MYGLDEPIVALASAFAAGPIAVVRTSGKGCVELAAGLSTCAEALRAGPGGTLHHGVLLSAGGDIVDEVVFGIYRAPASYTGEDSVEVFCHGSLPGIQLVVETLVAAGFRRAEPGEFTYRAFVNGKMDLTQAEAVHDLIRSKTRQAQSLALRRLGGGVADAVNRCKEFITGALAEVEVRLDYPEDELDYDPPDLSGQASVADELEALAATYRTGRLYQEGLRVAIAGRTNAGKSSLFNRFLKEDRAIVSEIHGTTRDYLEAQISLRGLPVILYDTAGVRRSSDPVEVEGLRHARRVTEAADVVLYVIDAGVGLEAEDLHFLGDLEPARTILAWNKVDRLGACPMPANGDLLAGRAVVAVSAKTGAGFGDIEDALLRVANLDAPVAAVVIDSERQRDLLLEAAAAARRAGLAAAAGQAFDMIAMDLREALAALGGITGEVSTTAVLESVFSRFCVGK